MIMSTKISKLQLLKNELTIFIYSVAINNCAFCYSAQIRRIKVPLNKQDSPHTILSHLLCRCAFVEMQIRYFGLPNRLTYTLEGLPDTPCFSSQGLTTCITAN